MRAVFAIARNTLTETVRQPAYGLVLTVGCLVLLLSPQFSGHVYTFGAGSNLEKPAERMVADLGLSTILFAGLVLGVLSTVNVVSREIENRTVMTVLSKRVGRGTFILGKFLGVELAVGLACAASLLFLLLTLRVGVSITAADRADWGVACGLIAAFLVPLAVATVRNYYWSRAWIGTYTLSFIAMAVVVFAVFALFDKTYRPSFLPVPAGEAYEALSYDVRQKIGITYDWEVFKAGIMMGGAVLVMASVAMAASTRLAPGGNLAVTAVVALAGLTSQYFRDEVREAAVARSADEWPRFFGVTIPEMLYNVYYALVPNLQHFWLSDALAREMPIPWSYVGRGMVYAGLYIAAMVTAASFLFEKREVG